MFPRALCLLAIFSVAGHPISHSQDSPKAQHVHTNRLAKESSPYLLQHAHNPVDWYPWGPEAFAKAKRENKLVFLSVGYAACHWCHVMERESFMDPEIAKTMNEKFVCVKVDREERPDVDQIYMTAIQLINGHGGWPMSVFLLPDGRPFWGGTYFPARDGDRANAPGFLTVMNQIDQAWRQQHDKVIQQAAAVTAAIQASQSTHSSLPPRDALNDTIIQSVQASLDQQYDRVHGGFGQTGFPKFPEPSNLVFLLDRARRATVAQPDRDQAMSMLRHSLDGMISGAMYDHIGGGFHRYSVDDHWQIPHFEKMLYDNGQLASIYAEVFHDTDHQEYAWIAEGICDFVIRELTAEGGAFYSSLDADSEGEEGKFYRWTTKELDQLTTQHREHRSLKQFIDVYHLKGEPNFEGEYFVPEPRQPLSKIASARSIPFDSLVNELADGRQLLFQIRSRRPRPLTDVKILTAWNGLMIRGLADAGRLLQRDDYVDAAKTAANFILDHSRTEKGRLKRSYAANKAQLNAYADDYALLTSGLIALHQATNQPRWLESAREITDQQIKWFWDAKGGGFFYTSSDHPELIVRVKDPVDGALPSAASVTAENLRYLARQTNDEDYQRYLEQTLRSIVPLWQRAPGAAPRSAAVLAAFLDDRNKSDSSPANAQP